MMYSSLSDQWFVVLATSAVCDAAQRQRFALWRRTESTAGAGTTSATPWPASELGAGAPRRGKPATSCELVDVEILLQEDHEAIVGRQGHMVPLLAVGERLPGAEQALRHGLVGDKTDASTR